MNAKRLTSAIVAMILVVCTLLTSCNTGDPVVTTTEPSNVTTATPDGTTTDGSSTTTQKPDGTTAPDNTTGSSSLPDDPAENCTHTTTAKQNAKDATCVLKGYTGDDVCTACGTIVNKGQEIDLIDHVYDSGKITKEPTCIEEGTVTFTCTGCGTTKKDSVAKTDHKDVYHDALDGTHNHTCENCTISDNAVHTPKDSGVKHAATCDSAEFTEHTCSLCNGVYKVYTEGSKALSCSFGDWGIAKNATCSEDGEMIRSCTRCGEIEKIAIPMNDGAHKHVLTNTFAASCTDEGTERYSCEYCGDGYTVSIPKIPHNFVSTETGNDGWTHKICECSFKLSTFDAKDLIEAEVKTDAIPENNSFEVSLEKADIVFPDSVVSQFKGSDSADLSIKADVMSDDNKNALISAAGSNLTEDQKNRLNDVPVYDFGVKLGGNYVEAFESEVTVTLPYELKEGEDPEGITVWYVKEDGKVESVQASYDENAKSVSFSVSHFSFYAIAYEETQEMRCKRGNHAYYATPVQVKASCTSHGYTLYECECCHYKNISDIVEKLGHNYGDVIQPEVNCTDGGYTHRVCADCGSIVNIDYVRATGHTPNGAATCEKPSVCTSCGDVIIPAKSHIFSEWETVKQPTSSSEGIKRRYCSGCGKEEEKAIPPAGLAEKIEFESYGQLINYVFRDLLTVENGNLSFGTTQTMGAQKMNMAYNITVESNGDNYSILIKQSRILTQDSTTREATAYILVRNGMAFEVSTDEDGSYVYINVMDTPNGVESLREDIYRSMSIFNQTFTAIFELSDSLVTLGELFPDQMNEFYASTGLDMDASELAHHIDTLKAEFVYIMSLFGVESEIEVPEGVSAGGIKNIIAVITDMMTKDGSGKYSYALSAFISAAKNIVDTYDEFAELPFTEFLYDFIKEDLLVKFPDLTSWALCESKLRESFPGSMKLSDAVDKIMTSVCGNDSAKLDSVYDAVNKLALIFVARGEEFDIEQLILEYADYTLDRLAQEKFECQNFKECLDTVFASLNEIKLKETIGSYRHKENIDAPSTMYPEDSKDGIVIKPSEPTEPAEPEFIENQFITTLRQLVYLYTISSDSGLNVTLDTDGMLKALALKLNAETWINNDSGEYVPATDINASNSASHSKASMAFSMSAELNNGAKITLPAIVESVKDVKISYNYDENGNIVINTNGLDIDFELSLNGHAYTSILNSLVKDDAMSAEKGFDVFTSTEYGQNEGYGFTRAFVNYNGKLYELNEVWSSSYEDIIAHIALNDLIKDPVKYVNVGENNGYFRSDKDELVPVYDSVYGLIYSDGGEWMIINDQNLDYSYHHEEYYDPDLGHHVSKEYKLWYDYNNGQIVSAKLTDVISTLSFSNFDNYYYYEKICENGKPTDLDIKTFNFSVSHELWNDYTLSLYGYFAEDGTVTLIDTEYHGGYYYYVLGDKVNPDDYKNHSQNEIKVDNPLYDEAGNVLLDSFTMIHCFETVSVPTYFVKVGDTCIRLRDLTAIATFNYESITLPDSSKLYVVFADGDTNNGIIYGYVNAVGNLYAKAACIFENGTLTDIVYREEMGSYYCSFDESEEDLASYITKTNAGYVVSAELINKYVTLCNNSSEYAYFSLSARSDWTDSANNIDFSIRLSLASHSVEKEYEDNYYNLDWSRAFENESYDSYTVYVNDDGSVSLFFKDGSKIKLELDGERWVNANDSMVTPNDSLSQETGLPVGSTVVTDNHYQSFLHVDGKYYYYDNYSVLKADTVSSVEELIGDQVKINELYYRYDFLDEASGNTYKVFYGSFTLNPTNYFGQYSIDLFVTIIDGKLMVLRGAEELGESVLKFEEIVSFDKYFSSLIFTVRENSYYSYGTAYMNGALRDIYRDTVFVYESEEDVKLDRMIGRVYAYYYSGASGKVYLKNIRYEFDAKGDHLDYIKKGSIATLPDNIVEIEDREHVAYNGIFTISEVRYAVQNKLNYIKIDGQYYHYDDNQYWNCYLKHRLTESQAFEKFGDLSWSYAVEKYVPGNGWCYFSCELSGYKKDYVVITNVGELVPNSYSFSHIGYTEDGESVYEIAIYSKPTNLTGETRPDGTVFYSIDGANTGYLLCPDGYYLRAERITDKFGKTYIHCYEIATARCELSNDELLEYFKSCITYSENGSVITFSKDIANVAEMLYGQNFYDYKLCFEISSDNYSTTLYINELLSYMGIK